MSLHISTFFPYIAFGKQETLWRQLMKKSFLEQLFLSENDIVRVLIRFAKQPVK